MTRYRIFPTHPRIHAGITSRRRALCLLLFFIAACSQEPPRPEGPPPVPISVKKVERLQDFQTLSVSGSVVSPYAPALVSFLVGGKILEALPREGVFVKKGEPLAAMDPSDYRQGALAAEAQAEQANVAFERASDEYTRMESLFEKKSLAPNDFQKFRAAAEASRLQVNQAAANRDIARKRLADTVLHAPLAGFISKRLVEPGQTVGAGTPAFEIVRLDPVEIQVGIPETDIHLLKPGLPARITLPALPDQSFDGSVTVINVASDPATRTYMTRISVPNPAHILKLGMVAEALIRLDEKIDVLVLPGEAVIRDPQGATFVFVYYPDQKRVYAKRVSVGSFHQQQVEIKGGLSGDERVVIAGQDKLREGDPAEIADASGKD